MSRGGSQLARRLYDELNCDTEYGPVLIPSPGIYRSIFAWDCGWHYYWLKHLVEERAVDELLTLFATRYPEGRISHETPLAVDTGVPLLRRFELWLLRRSFDERGSSWFIDPPNYLGAALEAAEKEKDGGKKKALLRGVKAKLAWFREHRCPEYAPAPFDRLPVIMHPFESGTDLAPSFDEVWGPLPVLLMKVLTLLKPLKRDSWSTKGKRIPVYPMVYDLTTITFYLEALKKSPGSEPVGQKLAEDFFHAVFDNENFLFRQYFLKRKDLQRSEKVTFSSILPCVLYGTGPFRETCRRVVERHCLPGKSFWRGRLPSFNPCEKQERSRHLWRGSCSWMNMNFMLFRILKIYGFEEEAKLLVERLTEYIDTCGPREYFDAFEPLGGGADFFSWNGLLLAMEQES